MKDAVLPPWTGLALVLVLAGTAAAVDQLGGSYLRARNVPQADSRLQALGRTLERLERTLAEHRSARDLQDRDVASMTGPARSLPGLAGLLHDASWIEDRLRMQPRLLSPFEPKVDRPTLIDVAHSTVLLHETLRDPESRADDRARALVALSRLPYAEAQFDDDTLRRWRTEAALAPDEFVLGLLFDVFAWVDAPLEVSDVLVTALRDHSSETIRRAAVVALGKVAGDPMVRATLESVRTGDSSRLVRDEAESVVRKLRYREADD